MKHTGVTIRAYVEKRLNERADIDRICHEVHVLFYPTFIGGRQYILKIKREMAPSALAEVSRKQSALQRNEIIEEAARIAEAGITGEDTPRSIAWAIRTAKTPAPETLVARTEGNDQQNQTSKN